MFSNWFLKTITNFFFFLSFKLRKEEKGPFSASWQMPSILVAKGWRSFGPKVVLLCSGNSPCSGHHSLMPSKSCKHGLLWQYCLCWMQSWDAECWNPSMSRSTSLSASPGWVTPLVTGNPDTIITVTAQNKLFLKVKHRISCPQKAVPQGTQ